MKNFMQRLTSRKFLFALASFLGNLAIAFNTHNEKMQAVSIVLATLSAFVYMIIEGINDNKSITVDDIMKNTKEIIKSFENLINLMGSEKNENKK